MGTHKTKINGTNYTITAGRTKINSTNYTQMLGRTLIGGTMYMITFSNPTPLTLMQNAQIKRIAGRNTKAEGGVSLTFTQAGTYYIFAFYNGRVSITKAVVASNLTSITLTRLNGSDISGNPGEVRNNAGKIELANSTTATSSYMGANGATIAALQFPYYSTGVTDTVLSGATVKKQAGRDASTTSSVSNQISNIPNGSIVLCAIDSYLGLTRWLSSASYVTFAGNHTGNQSLFWNANNNLYLSTTGTSSTSVYGGTIATIS